jgi:thiamine pyrophosphate-dependent acetolactate synthase large subunit-like protein
LPVITGKRAFLEILKQEGASVIFGNPGTTELAMMNERALEQDKHKENKSKYKTVSTKTESK